MNLTYPAIVVGTAIFSAIIALPVISFLFRYRIVRKQEVDFSAVIESRKEKYGKPIMGGLIFLIPILLINLAFNFNAWTRIPLIILAAMSALGAIDDLLNIFGEKRRRRGLDLIVKLIRVHSSYFMRLRYMLSLPWYVYKKLVSLFESHPGTGLMGHEKLLVQAVSGLLLGLWAYNELTGYIMIPGGSFFNIGILIIPFAAIILLSTTNAVNFSDGMDGLSSGLLVSSFVGFLIIAIHQENRAIALLCSTVIGGLITYLYFNIPPARVEMGDAGSFGMGALLACVAVALRVELFLPLIGLPFVIEALSSVVQSAYRRLFGKRLLKMAPLHHHFEMLGWSEEKVVMRFWIFSLCAMLVGLSIYFV